MAKRANRSNSRDGVDSDRIGRTGGRRGGERSVNGEMRQAARDAGSVHEDVRRWCARGGFRGAGPCLSAAIRAHKERRSRCFPASTRGKSGSGLVRIPATLPATVPARTGARHVLCGAQDKVDGRSVTREWEEDRHHFRLILSPEKGYEIADMGAYVRDVMQRIERDVGTKLDWIAIEHHNTDNPHGAHPVPGRTSRVKT